MRDSENLRFQSHHDSIINHGVGYSLLKSYEFQSHHDSIINPVPVQLLEALLQSFNPTMIRL